MPKGFLGRVSVSGIYVYTSLMIAINLNLGRGCQWTRQDGSWQATCKGAYHFLWTVNPPMHTNLHNGQLEGIQFGSCLRPRSSFSLESWRSHPKREIPGHFAHGLAVGDWSCSSIWSEAETPKHFPIARWFLHIAWAKGLWFFCFFRDRCFSGVFYQAADDWPHSWWKWKGRPNHSPSRKDALDSLLFFFAQGGGEEIQASSPFSVKKD